MIALLAHQGGWDEILLVLGPILLIAGLLRLAKQRVERAAHQHGAPHPPATPSTPSTPDPAEGSNPG